MLTKVLIFLAVIVGVFVVARMGAASAFKPSMRGKAKDKVTSRARRAEDLNQCPVCGSWSASGETCPCGNAPTP